MKLITERLILRQATLSDAHDIFTYRSNSAIHQFLSSEPKNIGDIEHFISNSAKE